MLPSYQINRVFIMSEQEFNLTPTRPYMSRAIYEWICDNNMTPYLLVDATRPNTMVPEQFIKDGPDHSKYRTTRRTCATYEQ